MAGLLTAQLLVRRDTAANWTSANPVLGLGELAQENDTLFHKRGDGVTAWTSLPYYHGPTWLQGLDGGTPSTTYAVGPNGAYHGAMAYPDPLYVPPKSIISTTIQTIADFDTAPKQMANDGDGNWVLVTNNDRIWYSSEPVVNGWTQTLSTVQASPNPQYVAVNDDNLWIVCQGQRTVYTSDDVLGTTWTERWDGGPNYNGVSFMNWSPNILEKFYTNGQNQMRLTTDGITFTAGANNGTATPQGFTDTGTGLYVWGHSGIYNPRNGFTTDANAATWTMNNNMPTTGVFTGAPYGPGDWDGNNWAIVANYAVAYRYWTTPDMNSWTSGTDLRYDNAKTDRIELFKYIAPEQKWYIITTVGDVYWSNDPTTGVSGWTEITTGNMVGIPPASATNNQSSVGPDYWMYTGTQSRLVINELG